MTASKLRRSRHEPIPSTVTPQGSSPCGKRVMATRRQPYAPSFITTPASNIEAAVGAATWYGHDRHNDFDYNHVHLRSQLIEYDPALAALCREVFGDTAPQYTRPATRLTDHMAGYNLAKAPKFEWPERLKQAKAIVRQMAEARAKGASASPPAKPEEQK